MKVVRRKMQNVARLDDSFLAADGKFDPPFHHHGHLFVRMRVFGSYDEWIKRKSADHDRLADNHLTPEASSDDLRLDLVPIRNQCRVCFFLCDHINRFTSAAPW